MITVHLKNGQVLNFPDGTSPEIMKGAISKNFPDQVDTPMGNIENAVANDVQRINQGQQPMSMQAKKPTGGPLSYEESPEEIGRNQGNKDYLQSGLPEFFVSMLAPELKIAQGLSKIPAAYKMLQQSPRAAKVLQILLGNAAPQSVVSAAFNPEDPMASAARTGGITAGLDAMFKTVAPRMGGAYKAFKSYLPSVLRTNKGITREIAEKIAPDITSQGVSSFERARKQGIHLMPHEAQNNVNLDALSDKLGTSPKGARSLQLYQEGKDVASEKAIENLNQKIFNREKLMPIKEAAFESVKTAKLPREAKEEIYKVKEKVLPTSTGNVKQDFQAIVKHMTSPNKELIAKNRDVRDAMNVILKDSTWQEALKHIPKKDKKVTGEFLIATKERMDDKLQSLYDSGQKKKAGHYKDSQSKFMEVLDDYFPKYEYGRSLHERQKARETIENLTSKGQPHAESFKKYFEDQGNKSQLINHLRNVKGGAEGLNELNDIFSRVKRIKPETLSKKINSKLYEDAPYSPKQFISKFVSALKGGKYDKAAVDLFTSKEWPQITKDLNKAKNDKQYIEKLSKYLVKAVPKRIGKENEPELEIVHNYNQAIPPRAEGAQ